MVTGGRPHYCEHPPAIISTAARINVSGSNGLALALTDEASKMNWSTAMSTCAAHKLAFSNGTWKLPSKPDWSKMISFYGCDNLKTNTGAYTGLKGGTWDGYWSSTNYDGDDYSSFYFDTGGAEVPASQGAPLLVRACLAF